MEVGEKVGEGCGIAVGPFVCCSEVRGLVDSAKRFVPS